MKKYLMIGILGLTFLTGCNDSGEYESNGSSDVRTQNETGTSPDSVSNQDEHDTEVQFTETDGTPIYELTHDITIDDLSFSEGDFGTPGDRTGMLELEEAALIGAQLFYEHLGIDVRGKHLEVTFVYNIQINHSTWNIALFETEEDVEAYNRLFSMIDELIDELETESSSTIEDISLEDRTGEYFSQYYSLLQSTMLIEADTGELFNYTEFNNGRHGRHFQREHLEVMQ